MAKPRTLYRLVGRYMRGTDTMYYALMSNDNREVKATEEQMAFYVGRDQVVNVKAQLYKDKVLFRGVGCDIKNLPIKQLGGDVRPQPKPVVQPKPKTKPVEQPKQQPKQQPKPVVNTVKKHYLDSSFVYNTEIDLSLPESDKNNTYEGIVDTILNKYSNIAYMLEKTTEFKDNEPLRLSVHNIIDNVVYVSVNIWQHSDKIYLAVSKSTFDLIKYEYPELIDKDIQSINTNQYKYCHYHELAIRMRLFSRISQYKKLKLQFVKYNNMLFEDKISHKIIMMVGEYKDGTVFDDLVGCGGYSKHSKLTKSGYPLILMKYSSFTSIDNIDNLDREDTCTLLHEMAHAYIDVIYGSNFETDPSNYGDVLYGMKVKSDSNQYKCHGKKFGTVIKDISNKTGFSFDELFCYGVHIDNTTRKTEYTSALGKRAIKYNNLPDVIFTENTTHKHNNVGYDSSFFRKAHKEIKDMLVAKQSDFERYFNEKFNITLKFQINDNETRLYTVDRFNNHRYYDINYNFGGGTSLMLYRIYEQGRPAMLKSFDFMTATQRTINRVLKTVYLDTVNN